MDGIIATPYLVHDEAESPAAARVGVGLQVDALDLAELAKVLVQLLLGDLLRQSADKQLPVVLVGHVLLLPRRFGHCENSNLREAAERGKEEKSLKLNIQKNIQ